MNTWADPEGVSGGPDPPLLKNQRNIGFLSNTSPDPQKNHKATKPAIIATFVICLDPLSPLEKKIKNKKNVVKVGPPLTKISGSAHGIALHTQVILMHYTRGLVIE